jgi:hypothetical protein
MEFMRTLLTYLSFFLLINTVRGQDTTGTGTLTGTVSEAGAEVCLEATGRCVTADGTGTFRLGDLRAGTYTLVVTAPGRPAVKTEGVEVRAGLESRVELTLPALEAVRQSVTVTEPVFAMPEEVKSSGYLVQPREIFKSAGALQDISRYLQTLPGVLIGSDDFRNDIIVRGGSPTENLFVVDNIEVPNINSFANFASAGGSVSILDPALIADTTFLTGGYPAPYINRTSSVLQITQREGARDELRGRATLGFAGAGGVLEGPIRQGRGSWVVSARRSFLDLFTDDIGIGGVPVNYSINAKVVYDLTPKDRIWVANLSGWDDIRLGARENPDEETELNNLDIRYGGTRAATGFNWQRLFGARGVGLLGVTHSEATTDVKVRDLVRNGVPPAGIPLPELLETSPVVFDDNSRERETTLKYDLTLAAPFFEKVQAGGAFKVFNVNYRVLSPFGSETPYSVLPDLYPLSLRAGLRAYQSSGYFQASRRLGSRVNATFGGRVDDYSILGQTRFSPRAGLSVRLTEKLSWRASFGSYYQQPFFLFLTAFPETRTMAPQRADHYVTGFSYIVSPSFRITLEGYRKEYRDYPVARDIPQLSFANIGDTFDVREILLPLASNGRGRAEGIELFLEKKFTDKWFGQANFAVSKTRHAGLDGILRPGSFDYPFVANFVGGYRLTKKWEVSTRVAYLSGRPFTPFNEALSREQRRGIFDLDRVNGERLPDYFRLDFRLDRTFTVRDKPLLVFLGVQNVINRQNVAGFTWNRRLNEVQTNDQLGFFPLIGMEWRF